MLPPAAAAAAAASARVITDPHASDPALLRDHSQFKAYTTSRFQYPEVRVFFRRHVKAHQLPDTPAPLPLLVCVPGLGGSAAQFHPLLSSLVDLAPCLAVDWPGGGRSGFALREWEAYTSEALLELLEVVIEEHRDREAGQGVVLIGHSMGTALAAALANKKVPHKTALAEHVVGLVAICPVSGPMDQVTVTMVKRLFWIPGWLFALWRAWDAMGGPDSPSVARFVGEGAAPELRRLQYRFNQQSRTPVWRRMAYGALPTAYEDGRPVGGIPGLDVWAGLDIPVYLIAGEADKMTKPEEVDRIVKAMSVDEEGDDGLGSEAAGQDDDEDSTTTTRPRPQGHNTNITTDGSSIHASSSLDDTNIDDTNIDDTDIDDTNIDDTDTDDPSTPFETSPLPSLPPQPRHPPKAIKAIILPSPANHTLLYSPRCVRALAGLVSDFLAAHVTPRLSLAWQLQHLSREGKWDVKNLLKWQSVSPVSDAIGPPGGESVFRVIKTLREVDDVHSPQMLVEKWGHLIKDVVDLSKDQPVYDPRGLERGGIHYHKFPTVSKLPPDAAQVAEFIRLVDALREAQRERAAAEGWPEPERCVVGVHCHYGFNRSGYFVVCYLVERCGFALADAIEAFRRARPNGIKHSHFLDKLYMRYNLEQRPETEG